MGFNNTWIFLTDVLPRAIKKYGGFDAEALRKAALETDIPVGGTMQGYGVKFFRPGTRWPDRTSALPGRDAVRQRRGRIVWPKETAPRPGAAASRRARVRG